MVEPSPEPALVVNECLQFGVYIESDLRSRLIEHSVDGLERRVGLGVKVGLGNVARSKDKSFLRRFSEENEENLLTTSLVNWECRRSRGRLATLADIPQAAHSA